MELGAYGITYAARNAIKGQVLASFLADTMAKDGPTNATTAVTNKTLIEGEVPEVRRAAVDHVPIVPPDEADTRKLYTDGASNDHGSGARLILIDPEGKQYTYALRLNVTNSNHDVEYEALLASLRIAIRMKYEKIYVFVDSKLVASQLEGSYEAKEYIERGILPEYATEARTIKEKVRNYVMEDGALYRKSYFGLLLRCMSPQQAKYVIREIHMRSCGMHDGPGKAVYAVVPRLPKDDMVSVTSAWPFQKFGIPAVIITDNGTQLINDPFKSWAEGLGIKLVSTSVYHP
ncbi:reverse transcriptase domain-containing protein [Tanacetum coccineum]